MKKLIFLFLFLFSLNAEAMNSTDGGLDDDYTYGHATLKNIFFDNKEINAVDNKVILLVFGQDGCYYCRLLIKSITSNDLVKDYLKNNFSPYYINVTREKRHKVNFLQLEGVTSKDFARLYNLTFTPLIVFINIDGDVIMRLQGYPGDKALLKALEYVADDKWKVYKNEKDRIKGFVDYAQINSN